MKRRAKKPGGETNSVKEIREGSTERKRLYQTKKKSAFSRSAEGAALVY